MSEMEQYKSTIKKNIEFLVGDGNLEEAKKVIKEYENIVPHDVDIYSIKGVIAMMEGDTEDAEKILKKGVFVSNGNFDLFYNLAYLYETQEKYIEAYRYYKKVMKFVDQEMENEVKTKLEELKKIEIVKKYINRKKILVVAHIFPPMGGSGVQRTLKFVKYLRKFNWEPIVVTVGKTCFKYLKDDTLEIEIPEGMDIIRIDEELNIDSMKVKNLLNNYRNLVRDERLMSEYINAVSNYGKENNSEDMLKSLLLPDVSSFWAMDVINKIHNFIDFNEIDAIYTTSGPYSDHIIGYFLKEKYNKPWVTDFRDEWTNNPYFDFDKNNIAFKIIEKMEQNILWKADKILTTTPLARENYINILNVPSHKIVTITNGYDEEDFKDVMFSKIPKATFQIIHNGMLYMIRTPETFLKAIKNLVYKRKIDKNKIKVIFSYTEYKEKWQNYLKDNNLESIVDFKDYMSHEESIKLSINSDLLLLIVGSGEKNKSVYTGKVFEYLRMGKPILALSPKGSVVENLLKETNSGENFEYDDITGIENYILKAYKKWENNSVSDFILNDNIAKYEREYLTKRLAKILDELYEINRNTLAFEEYKKQIKNEIQILINDTKLYEANMLIEQYFKIVKNDIEAYSIKAVILIMQDNFDEAEKMLKEGLTIDDENFDLNYNLGYVYERQDNKDAIRYYIYAYNKTLNKEVKRHIKVLVENIIQKTKINENFDVVLKRYTVKKKCLILCSFYSIFTKEFIENMKKYDYITFDVLTTDSSYINEKEKGNVNEVYLYKNIYELNQVFNSLNMYDIVHIHFLDPFYSVLSEKIKEKCDNLLVSIWGSDYYRMSDENRKIQENILDISDYITIANSDTIVDFNSYYDNKYAEKVKNCRFGLKTLEYIELVNDLDIKDIKKEFNIPENAIVITCGYNASQAHNHLRIIESIYKEKKILPPDIYFLFPMTYGGSTEYIEEVSNCLERNEFKYIIFDKFLDYIDIAKIRKITDIMIQVQNTDQLSGSMQEHLYCNNIVITGKWLPYNKLKSDGCFFLDVSSISDIGSKISHVISNMYDFKEKCKNNKKIISNLSLWKNAIVNWKNIYENSYKSANLIEQPVVTVGIASYNHSRYLGRCVNSVLSQTYNNIELLIVDDNSNDGSIQKIKKYEKEYSNIKTIYHSNNYGAPALSFQEIINEANGEYFILLCSDDLLANDNVIMDFVKELEHNKKVDFVFGNLRLIDSEENEKGVWSYKQYTNNQIVEGTFRTNGSAMIPMIGGIFRKQFYKKHNRTWFSDKVLGETDTLNTLINVKYGCNLKYLNKDFIKYRQHNSNMTYDISLVINARVQHLEFIINNFSEEIYFPEINWKDYNEIEREAAKMFLIGNVYAQFFKSYYQGVQGPWKEVIYKLDEVYRLESLDVIVFHINKYFNECIKISNIYNRHIYNIQNELNEMIKFKKFNFS
ncbi:MAG: glycosyltransferase [Clostridium sp.]|nr:glycosyltransferase [Clostridium sp.]